MFSAIMSLLIIFLCVIFISMCSFFVFLLLFYYWRWPSEKKKCQKLPSPRMLPILGIGLQLITLKDIEFFDYVQDLINQHGSIFYAEILGRPHAFISEPENIELVLSNSQHITKGFEYLALLPWLSEGLLTSTGSKWHTRRKMLTPTFHFKILETFIPIFNRNAKILIKNLTVNSSHDTEIDVEAFISLCTLDIICESAMGTTLDSQMGEAKDYVGAIKIASDIIMKRNFTFWMYTNWIFNLSSVGRKHNQMIKNLHRFTEKVIKERKEYHNQQSIFQDTELEKKKQRKSFLDHLIEIQKNNSPQMTDEDIREEVDTFMFEGHDTTSVAITWSLFMIAVHQDVQEKLHEEMDRVFENSDRDATIDDLQHLNYLDMVIKESLRLYPSVPYISRLLTTELKIKNYTIPPNVSVSIIPYLIHRNPLIFPDPEKFVPERFLPHLVKERHPYAYIPFSAGFRNCIGQKFAMLEEKIILSTIIRKLKLRCSQKKEDVKVIPAVVLRANPNIKISFTPRNR